MPGGRRYRGKNIKPKAAPRKGKTRLKGGGTT